MMSILGISITGSVTALSFLAAGLGFNWNDTVDTFPYNYANYLTTFDLIYASGNNSYTLLMSVLNTVSVTLIPWTVVRFSPNLLSR